MSTWKKSIMMRLFKTSKRSGRRVLRCESLEDRVTPAGLYAVASAAGSPATVDVFDATTNQLKFTLTPYQNAQGEVFSGAISVAVGDVNGDGTLDIITAAGATGGPHVQVFDGVTGLAFRSFYAYDPTFTGGVSVAVGDVDGDGKADIVTGAKAGGGPHVQVFSGATGAVLQSFYAYDPTFTGGVNVAVGDINGDGKADIVTGAAAGGNPHVQAFDGATGAVLQSFYAYDQAFSGGVNVAVGDINGDGKADIITGAGAGGGPHVRVFDGTTGATLQSFFAGDPSSASGVNVAALDVNGDGKAEIITAPGSGGQVEAFDGTTLGMLTVTFSGLPAGTGYDTTAPSVALTTSASDPTSANPLVFTATFSEGVNSFTTAGVTVTNGSISNFTQIDGRTYTFEVIPTAVGSVTVAISANAATDAAGNANTASTVVSRTYQLAPTAPTTFSAASPPDTAVGATYSYTFIANGSPAPTYAVTSGALPDGLTLSSSGLLSGTPTVAGSFTFVVTATNSAGSLASSPITLDVAAIAAANSAVTSDADGASVGVNGAVTVTLAANDGAGNPVSGLTDVAFALTAGSTGGGTFGPVTDNGDGTYTATFTATTLGAVTFTAATGGVTVTDAQAVTVTAVAAANSAVTSDADGTSVASGDTVTVTLAANDGAGNPVSGLTDVAFALTAGSTGGGTFGPVTDNGDGTYTATFTAVGAGAVTFTATTGTVTVTDTQAVEITAGPVDEMTSAVTSDADGASVGVNGTVTVTLAANDGAGNPVSGLTDVVFGLAAGSTGDGTFGPVTDNGDGTYTATFTAVGAGAVTFTATTGTVTVTDTQAVEITAVAAANSAVTSDADGASVGVNGTVTVTLAANDGAGNPVSGLTDVVFGLAAGSTGDGTFGPVTDNGDGTYTATFTAVGAGAVTFTATTGGVTVTNALDVTIV